ncbi:MAG: gliding motility-associated C-terminal domain-containing protein [Bacteroidota bacterium]
MVDTQAPVLANVPTDVVASCDPSSIPAIPTNVTATDNCDSDVEVLFSETTTAGSCPDSYVIERTWTATDNCGNTVSATQQISVGDNNAPTINTNLADVTIECDEAVPAIPQVGVDIMITDDCDDDLTVNYSEEIVSGSCAGSYILTRKWIVTDNCGNESSVLQQLTVGDNTPPVLDDMPDDISIDCNGDGILPDPPIINATDNCDSNVTVTYEENSFPGECVGTLIVIRTWTATDACGNSTSGSYTIEVGDFEAPMLIGIPNDITIDLSTGQTVPPPPNNIFATDNCDFGVNIEFSEFQVQDPCGYTIYRQWEAMDDCGNFTQANQVITVSENLSLEIIPQGAFICEGGSLEFAVEPVDPSYTYFWTASSGMFDNPTLAIPTYTATQSGNIDIGVTINLGNGCFLQTTLTIDPGLNINGGVGNNGPICSGGDLQLTANGGQSYVWLDPNGNVISTEQNPIITNVTAANAGTYTVQVTTPTCYDELTTVVEITEGFDTNIDVTPETCTALGVIDITMNSGVSPFTFEWSPTVTDASNVEAGVYQVTITDATGCETIIENIEVLDDCVVCETPIIANTNIVDASCEQPTGAISISMTNTSQSYVFDWNTLTGNSNAQVNIPAGTYPVTISVQGQPDCKIDTSFTIINTHVPEITIMSTTPATCQAPDGTATLSPDSLTYVWSDGGGGAVRNSLTAGDYTVTATNVVTGCSKIVELTIDATNNLTVDADLSTTECVDTSGVISLTVNGGSGEYTYQWSNDSTTQIITGLSVGDYEVTVADFVTGCTATTLVILDSIPCEPCVTPVVAIAQVTDAVCGEAVGSITIEMQGGNTDYNFIWENTPNNTNTISDLAAGIYNVTISEVGDSTCFLETSYIVGAPTTDVQLVSIVPDSCGVGVGSILLSPATIDYTWSNGDTTAFVDSLTAGNYSVTATDANGCEYILTDMLVENYCCQIPGVVTTLNNEVCGNANGAIEVGFTGNADNPIYTWTPNVSDTSVAENLTAGTYQLQIQFGASASCVFDTTFIIGDDVSMPTANIVSNQPASCSGADGQVIFQPTNLNYDWGNGVTGSTNSNLSAGIYTVTISDDQGCSTTVTVEVESINPLDVIADVSQAGCDGGTTGSANIVVNNGSGNYSFVWADGNTQGTRTDLTVGDHSVTVTDLNTGCQDSTAFSIIAVTPGEATIMIQDTIVSTTCEGGADAGINFFVNYSPFFHHPATMLILDQNGNQFNNDELPAGDYCLTIEDANGCTITSRCFEVIEPDPIIITRNVIPVTCDELGSISITNVTGGTPDYTFDWEHIPGTDDPQNITDLSIGSYAVTVTDSQGCMADLEINIVEDCNCENPEIALIEVEEENCSMANGAITITMQGDLSNYTFAWSPSLGNTNALTNLTGGDYTVTITDINNSSCFIVNTTTVQAIDGLVVDLTTSPATCSQNNGQATLMPDTYTYAWDDGFFGNTRTDLIPGTHLVTVTDNASCATEYEVVIDDENTNCTTIDTLYFTTLVNEPLDSICVDLSELPGTLGATLPCNDPTNGTLVINSLDTCLTYIPNNDFIGIDTACVATCNTDGICDTTILIINVIPDCQDFVSTDSIILNVDNCDSLYAVCVEIPFADISTYEITDNGMAYNATLDSCGNNTQLQLGVGNHQLIFTETATGCTDTTIVIVNCPTVVDPCPVDLIAQDSIILFTDCESTGELCVEISLNEILDYEILVNGQAYNDLFAGCNFDSVVSYHLFVLPGKGNFGPYQLDSWMFNGQSYSAPFATINELVDSMNVWDTSSTWKFDDEMLIIYGGTVSNNTFGNMLISQVSTGASATIEVNTNLEPTASQINLPIGFNQVIFENNVGCVDTVMVLVSCVSPDILTDTIEVGTIDTMCIESDQLIGNVVSYENTCEDSSGEYVIFSELDGTWCVQYEGIEVGQDSACIVLCDDFGICDTTFFFVTVIDPSGGGSAGGQDSLPVARIDRDTFRINTSTVIDILNNDTINGILDTVYITEQPGFGNAIFDENGNVVYTPNEDYCDTAVPDEFTYVLCNMAGCDTATVFLYVLCDDLIIYNGFSPNNDGVNEVFYIEGVENYPDNELQIFNRWGNEVYFEQGYLNNWRGTWAGKPLADGTYFYVFSYVNADGKTVDMSGYVQIHR